MKNKQLKNPLALLYGIQKLGNEEKLDIELKIRLHIECAKKGGDDHDIHVISLYLMAIKNVMLMKFFDSKPKRKVSQESIDKHFLPINTAIDSMASAFDRCIKRKTQLFVMKAEELDNLLTAVNKFFVDFHKVNKQEWYKSYGLAEHDINQKIQEA